MRRSIIVCFLLFASSASAQSLSVFNLEATNFPTIKAKFYSFDANGNQQNPSASEITVVENGISRDVTSVTCPVAAPLAQLSSVLVMDVSGSMGYGAGSSLNIDIAKAAATYWISNVPLGESECAITSFDDANYFNQDYTTNRVKLANAIAGLHPQEGTNYDAAFLLPVSGGLEVTKFAKHQRVIVFLSDGLPNFEPQTSDIIAEAQKQNCLIFGVTVGLPCPQCLKDISTQTGGKWFENITTQAQIEEVYAEILQQAQGESPCEITWQSTVTCIPGKTDVQVNWNGQSAEQSYTPPSNSVASLQFSPQLLYVRSRPVGIKFDTAVTITANNSAFSVTNITSTNSSYDINPKSFTLAAGQSQVLTVSYTPPDSSYTWTRFDIATDLCPQTYYASGSYLGHKPNIQTLKLIQPNGGEQLVVGADTVIAWTGIPLTDTVKLEYSTDEGSSWNLITDKATGGRYGWHVPKKVSDRCLVRVTLFSENSSSLLHVFRGFSGSVVFAEWNPSNTEVATLCREETVTKIWDVGTGNIVSILPTKDASFLQWSPNEKFLMTCGSDSVKIWELSTKTIKLVVPTQSPSPDLRSVASWNPDGTEIAVINAQTVDVWDVVSGIKIFALPSSSYNTWSVRWSPDGKYIAASASQQGEDHLWDALTGSITSTFKGGGDDFNVSFSAQSTYAAFVTDMGLLVIPTSNNLPQHLWSNYFGSVEYEPNPWSSLGDFIAIPDSAQIKILDVNKDSIISRVSSYNYTHNPSYAWHPSNLYLLTNGSDSQNNNNAEIRRIEDNTIVQTLIGHDSTILFVVFSPNGDLILTTSADSTARLWQFDPSSQSDTSDAVFSIVMPQAFSDDLDMGNVPVNSAKDSVIGKFIRNGGPYPFHIDSIAIVGADASQFALVSGIPPFVIPGGGAHQVEFDFHPTSSGTKSAQIEIFTQADTLFQNITGIGILPDLEITSTAIDLGKVQIGTHHDTTISAVIQNHGNISVQFTSSSQLGPDTTEFSILSGATPFTLAPGSTHDMTLRFAPNFIGRTSGRIGFANTSPNSPLVLTVFGQGLGALISIPDDSGYGGDHKNMPVILQNESLMSLQSVATNFQARIAYDKTVLSASGGNIQTGKKFDTLTITNSIGKSDTLAYIPFIALSGKSATSPMRVVDFVWLNGAGQPSGHDVETESGIFHLLGGIEPPEYNWASDIVEIYPNPATESFHFEVTLSDPGNTQIALVNLLGQQVAIINDGELLQGRHEFDFTIHDLPTGSYFLTLKTPNTLKIKKVDIYR